MPWSSGSSIRTSTIGRSPEMPCAQSAGGARRVALEHARRRAQRRVGVQDPVGQALEQVGLVRPDAEVVELDLRPGPGQRRRALEHRGIAILLGEREGLVARRRDQGREDDAGAGRRRQAHPPPQAEDRIEHRAGRVRQRPAVDHRHRRSDPAAATEKPHPVGLVLRAPPLPGPRRRPRGRPRRTAPSGARARRVANRASSCGDGLGLHEEVREHRVRRLRGGWREHELGVRGDLDLPRPRAEVGERHATELGVVLRRDDHLEGRRDRAVPPVELGAVLEEGRAVRVRRRRPTGW